MRKKRAPKVETAEAQNAEAANEKVQSEEVPAAEASKEKVQNTDVFVAEKSAEKRQIVIEAKQINRIFHTAGGPFQALKDINLEIPEGTLAILKGRSGSGKTTLLNILGALDKPTSGQVFIDGRNVCRMSGRRREKLRRKQMGFVFQAVSLIPTMNAYQNVEFSMRMAGIRKKRAQRVEECLKLVGLGSRMKHMPAEMSGGEQQRVAIARALAHRPRIIFADEPTAELDSAMGAEVVRLFKEMCEKERVTIVMTTHDVGLMSAGDEIIELENGQRITHAGEDAAGQGDGQRITHAGEDAAGPGNGQMTGGV